MANVDGASRLALLDLGADREVPVAGLPPGLIDNLHFDRSGGRRGIAALAESRSLIG